MKIGFVTAYSSKNPAGLERATIGLLKSLLKNDQKNEYVIYTKNGSNLKEDLGEETYCAKYNVVEVGFGSLWKEIGLFFSIKSDLYIFNGQQVPLFFNPKEYYVIVYDFAYRIVGGGSRYMDFVASMAFRRAKKILAISEATKRDIEKFFKVRSEKIKVFYFGFNDISKTAEEKILLPDRFFLFASTIKKRKNLIGALKAFDIFLKNNPKTDFKFVVVGKHNDASDYFILIKDYIKQNNLGDFVVFLGHVSDNQLVYIYKKAHTVVYPSFVEGFGFPVLEAFSCGTPVIASNTSSIPEVSGGAALLIDPDNPKEIFAAMEKIAKDSFLRSDLIKRGYKRAGDFSWKKCALNFLDIIYNIV